MRKALPIIAFLGPLLLPRSDVVIAGDPRQRTTRLLYEERIVSDDLLTASVDTSKPASCGQVKTGQWASGRSDIYLIASSAGKASPILVRQLRGPHLRTWPWWRRRSSMAATAAASPSTLPQSSTGRFEVKSVLERSYRRITSSS